MTGIPDDQYEMVLANTNIIVSGADPEFLGEDLDQAVLQLLGAGQALAGLLSGLAAARAEAPAEDLVSALVTVNIDEELLSTAELASSFILWWWRATRGRSRRSCATPRRSCSCGGP